jgi:ribosomal protein L24
MTMFSNLLKIALIALAAVPSLTATTTSAAEIKKGDTVAVSEDGTKLMAGEKVVATLKKGTKVAVSDVQGDWICGDVELDGKKLVGWVQSSFIAPSANVAATAPGGAATATERAAGPELDRISERLAEQIVLEGAFRTVLRDFFLWQLYWA